MDNQWKPTVYWINTKIKLLILVGMIAVLSAPLLCTGVYLGHDSLFHLARIEALSYSIREAELPAYIPSFWLQGYGYPASVYYGDILLLVPSLLHVCGIGLNISYKVYVLVVNTLAVLISFFSFRSVFKEERVALFSTALYVFCSYRFLDTYVRFAVGEYTALCFLPMIVASLYVIYTSDIEDKLFARRLSWALSVGLCMILTSHVLSTLMVCIVMGIFFLLTFKQTFQKPRFLLLLVAVGKTVLLSAFFLIPFLDFAIRVPTKASLFGASEMLQKGPGIYTLLAFFRNAYDNDSLEFNQTIGPALLLVLLFAGVLLFYAKTSKTYKLVYILSLLVLLFATEYFPWTKLCEKVSFLHLFLSIQFAWRWLGIASVLCALMGGLLIMAIPDEVSKKTIMCGIGLIAVFMCLQFDMAYVRDAERQVIDDAWEMRTDNLHGQEYLLDGTDIDERSFTLTGDGFEQIGDSALQKGCRNYPLKVTKTNAYADVPIYNYPYYRAYTDNGERLKLSEGAHKTIRVHLPNHYEGKISVAFHPPLHWYAAIVISLIGWAYLMYRVVLFLLYLRKSYLDVHH